jgi:hypothetical protein
MIKKALSKIFRNTEAGSSGSLTRDSSDRPDFDAGYRLLFENRLKYPDFRRTGRSNAYGRCTSVFYRPQNCFEI